MISTAPWASGITFRVRDMKHEERLEHAKLEEWKLIGDEDQLFVQEHDVKPYKKGLPGRRVTQFRGFSRTDLNVLKRTKPKLEKVLNRVPWKFRLYFFLEPTSRHRPLRDLISISEGPITRRTAFKAFDLVNFPVPGKWNDSINVLIQGSFFNQAAAGRNMPPTSWVIVHWIGHVVLKAGSDNLGNAYYLAFHRLLTTIYEGRWWPLSPIKDGTLMRFDVPTIRNMVGSSHIIESMFSFRSARERNVRTFFEGVYEIFSHYIHQKGQIGELNPPPETIFGGAAAEFTRKDAKVEPALERFAKDMETAFERDLGKAVGEWFTV